VTTLRFNHGQTLQQEWVSAGRGQLLFLPSAPLAPLVQFRPEYQRSLPLLDVRVRKAMAYGIDKDGVSDALYPGVPSTRAETIISKLEPYYEQVDRAIAKYPFDGRKVEENMAEAGLTKDRDGFYADASGTRFRPDFQVLTNVDSQRMQLIVSDTWKQLGIDVQPNVLPQAQVQDNEARAKFSGLATPGSALGLERDQAMRFHSNQIGTAANRWRGANQGWVSPDYDRLFDRYDVTLDRAGQIDQVVQMMKLLSEEVPVFPVYYNIYVIALASGISGPTVATASTIYWNLQDWEYR